MMGAPQPPQQGVPPTGSNQPQIAGMAPMSHADANVQPPSGAQMSYGGLPPQSHAGMTPNSQPQQGPPQQAINSQQAGQQQPQQQGGAYRVSTTLQSANQQPSTVSNAGSSKCK